MSKADLKLDWCSYQAAKYAVEHWHYSKTMPAGKAAIVGVWEFGKFIGCVIFSRGATPNLSKHHGLPQTEICELTRVALSHHNSSVSRIVAIFKAHIVIQFRASIVAPSIVHRAFV